MSWVREVENQPLKRADSHQIAWGGTECVFDRQNLNPPIASCVDVGLGPLIPSGEGGIH